MKTKTILQTLLILFFAFSVSAQQGINYKAIINDANGAAIVNTAVTVQFTILETGTTEVYKETHTPTTDANGIVIVNIGEGTVVSGVFNDIDWGSNPHFLKTEINTGSGLTDMGTTEFKTVPYALHSITAEKLANLTFKTYSVGDFAQGGIVFWVDETGQHGLVCAKEDQSTGIRWDAGVFEATLAWGDGLFAGEANTLLIIATQVDFSEGYWYYFAASICNQLQIIEEGKTYGDWYLPSKEELNLMYQNKATIDAIAIANEGSSFESAAYWSSTEHSQDHAWLQNFHDGSYYETEWLYFRYKKDYEARVRAIRTF